MVDDRPKLRAHSFNSKPVDGLQGLGILASLFQEFILLYMGMNVAEFVDRHSSLIKKQKKQASVSIH